MATIVAVIASGAVKAETAIPPRELWPQATAAADGGDIDGATQKTDQLLESARLLGIRRFPLFANSAASLGRQEQKDPKLSTWAMTSAERLDPLSPSVAFTRADIAKDQANWPVALSSAAAGIGRTFSDYRTRHLARGDLTLVLIAVLSILAGAFALILFFRYQRSAAHDFREMLGATFSGGVGTVLGFSLLFLPVFLWLGPVWLVVYWLALFFAYATAVERFFIVAALVVLALVPIAASWTASHVAGLDSPVVSAALSASERSFQPAASRRLREMIEAVSTEPALHLLLGNLEALEGNEQEAALRYRRAIELNDKLAGAYLNIGNLHFFNNDFPAAVNNYEKAEALDPTMAIAYYNHAVVSGETYKFEEQGKNLELAKKYDRSLIEGLIARPRAQKIVMYQLPVAEAWAISQRIAREGAAREVFGSYSSFDLSKVALNPLTLGALIALALASALFVLRKSARAGECIKCGRTFCPKCKSARDSSTYCTQCIHIYLKKDGVSLDTKRSKIEEVQEFQTGALRLRKLVSSFLPGAGQIMDGNTIRGLLMLGFFLFFVAMAFLVGRMAPVMNPAETARLLVRGLAIAAAVVLWLIFTLPVYRQRFRG